MIHDHDEILELASASLDFELTPAERSRLESGLAGCEACRRTATTYRRQAGLVAALPMVDASPAVRRRIERAAGARPQRTTWSWYLAAAALVALLAASIAVVGAIRDRQDRDLGNVMPTPSPSWSVAPSPSPSSSVDPDVIELDPPSGVLADVGPALPRDSLAVVSVRNLRLRSQPFVGAASIKYEPFLQPGDRLFIVDGPVIGHNYEWYQVAAWRPGAKTPSWPVGWVARAGHDAEVWLRPTTAECPSRPIDLAALQALAPAERLACFGSEPIAVRAIVMHGPPDDCAASRADCPVGPGWLAQPGLTASISEVPIGMDRVTIAVAPGADSSTTDLPDGRVVRLEGAFDDPAAQGCRPAPDPSGASTTVTPEEARLRCRTRFVVTHAQVEAVGRLPSTAAVTVSDRLRVRSLPEVSDASIRFEPLLPLGTRLVVIDGPVLGSDYSWFRVIVPVPSSGTTVRRWLVGWVAAGGKDGEPWIKSLPIACPSGANLRAIDIARLRQRPVDDGPLTCFGADPISVVGRGRLVCQPDGPDTWLSSTSGRRLDIVDGSTTISARVPPGADLGLACGDPLGPRSRFQLHADDPAASACRLGPDPADRTIDERAAVYWCRTRLVVAGVSAAGE
ncbi:MAG TPA: zf-HC2 domain-containing protein [Candidatus Limnocylindrales bacterium]|jgi:hypothetical protein|nr:zf-HC2 domain-containing protein [Candidatus Limnocylindrales bacterium]